MIHVILLVEDEFLVAAALEASLLDAGFCVVTVHSGVTAMQHLDTASDEITAVVTDIRLPGAVSGWDIGVAAREKLPDVPVIYCTGDSAADWRAKGVLGSRMLPKPFSLEEMVQAVAEVTSTTMAPTDGLRVTAR